VSAVPPEDQRLREAFAAIAVEDTDTVSEADDDAIWDAIRGDLDAGRVAELAERIAADPAFAEKWRVAMEFVESASADEEETVDAFALQSAADLDDAGPAGAPANGPRYLRWVVVGASVAAAVVLTWWLRTPQTSAPPSNPRQMRASDGDEIQSSIGEGPVSRVGAKLAWSEVPGAERYEVFVTTEALQQLVSVTDLTTPMLPLDAEVVADVPTGGTILWRVEAVMPDGTRRQSTTFPLRLDQ
jgi:hypothetical protein